MRSLLIACALSISDKINDLAGH